MLRKLEVLGLIVFCALSATEIPRAVGHTPAEFIFDETPATVTGNQAELHRFTITGHQLACTTITYHGVVSVTQVTQITIIPTYKECIINAGGLSATVTGFSNGNCWYAFHANGFVDLECKAGTDVTVDAGTCVIHFPPQANIGTVTYTTGVRPDGRHDLNLQFAVTLKTVHTDGFLCALTSTGEGSLVWEGESTWIAETQPGNIPLNLTYAPTIA